MTSLWGLASAGAGFLCIHAILKTFSHWHIQNQLHWSLHKEPRYPRLELIRQKLIRAQNQKETVRQVPYFLELLALGLSSGLNFDQAWNNTLPHLEESFFKQKVSRASNQIFQGRAQSDALSELTEIFNDSTIKSIFQIMVQGLCHGTPLESIILDQADFLRLKNYHAIEKKAHMASVRLLFPLVFIIFPAIFIVLFGPLVLHYIYNGTFY